MVIAALVVSISVAIAVIYREFIHDWFVRPKMEVTFSLEKPISCETIYEYRLGGELKAFWPRLRVKNNGKSMARRCEGILTEVRNPKGELITRYEMLPLRWAILPYARGSELLDIASKRVVHLNTLFIIQGWQEAYLVTTTWMGGLSEVIDSSIYPKEYFEPGDYWLRIVIYGDNFHPVERGYAVHWDGMNYKEVGIKEMNEKPSATSYWPWRIDKEPDKHPS